MARKKFVIANWKMNPGRLADAEKLFDHVKKKAARTKGATIVVCPPVPFIDALSATYRGKSILFGAQDIFWKSEGAYTGEVSPTMLKDIGVSYVIVGHSERRARGESDEEVNKKMHAALDVSIRPILCIGESARDRGGSYLEFLRKELKEGLKGVAREELPRVLIAYEPLWAIGKTSTDAITPHKLYETVLFIRKVLVEMYDKKDAFKIPILYGGSVEEENAHTLLKEGEVDGFLVGHASLDAEEFIHIILAAHG